MSQGNCRRYPEFSLDGRSAASQNNTMVPCRRPHEMSPSLRNCLPFPSLSIFRVAENGGGIKGHLNCSLI